MQQSITVNGWNLVKFGEAEERRILDVELGERLGYADPLKVQRVIDALIADGELPGVVVDARTVVIAKTGAVRATEERVVKAYYLTEREALQVIAKSRTKTAHKITNEIIDVYLVVKHGATSDVIALQSQLAMQSARIDSLLDRVVQLDRPQLRASEAASIRSRVTVLSALRNAEQKLSKLVAFRRADNELRGRVGYPVGNGHRWESFPRHRLGDVLLALDEMESEDAGLTRAQARHSSKKVSQTVIDFPSKKRLNP